MNKHTKREAGRKGGLATVQKHGTQHMAKIGRKGAQVFHARYKLEPFGIGDFAIVRKYGKLIDMPNLSPHDMRRTYAHLGYDAGVPITQIKELLGHASIATTQRYLDLSLDLDTTASDFVPLSGD